MSRSSNCRDCVCVITVLSVCAITVQAAAQVTDGKAARGDARARSDTARLAAEPGDQGDSVVAGGEKAFISLTPAYSNANGEPYNQAALGVGYSEENISGNTLAVEVGGFRAFFHVEAGQWDSTAGSGITVRSTSLRLDASTMLGENASPPNPGCDILQLNVGSGQEVPCTNPLVCQAEFNSAGFPTCGGTVAGFCNWGWINTSKDPHADGKHWIHSNTWLTVSTDWALTSPVGPLCFSTADPTEPRPDDQYPAPYYIGTLALWVPECAKGTYTLGFVGGDTYLADQANVRLPELGVPTNYRQAVLTIPVGSCCHDIGSESAGCIDGLTDDECYIPGNDPAEWVEDGVCANPPTNDGCCACLEDDDCHETPDDLCTNDTCTDCVCSSTDIPEWDPDECCDAATGATCTPTPENTCQTAACSLPGMRGTCETTSIPEGEPCTEPGDGNPCTFDDLCQSDESCAGTDVNSAMIPCVDDAECRSITGLTAPTCVSDVCDCSLVPDPPRTPDPDPFASHVPKNRYISMVIPEMVTFTGYEDSEGFAPGPIERDSGDDQATAIRVRLIALYHAPDPVPWGAPDFSAWEGEYRWVNAYRACIGASDGNPTICDSQADCDERKTCQGGSESGRVGCADQAYCDDRGRGGLCLPVGGTCQATTACRNSPNFPGTPFYSIRCAVLGCEPEYRAWGKELGGEVLHVAGAAVVPSSVYHVEQFGPTCQGNEATCGSVSTPELEIITSQFGDVAPPQLWGEALNVLDIAHIVDHVKGRPYPTTWPPAMGTSMSRALVNLRPNVPNPVGEWVGILDIATAFNAVKGLPYWHFGDYGPCTDACPGEAACP